MQTAVKLAISLGIIVLATQVGKWKPSLAGLIATMPLTGFLVMAWLYFDHLGDQALLSEYAKGAFWGGVPSFLFFLTAFAALAKGVSFPAAAGLAFAVWLAGAACHQWFLG